MFDFDKLEEAMSEGSNVSAIKDDDYSHIPDIDFVEHIREGMKRLDNNRPEDGWFHPSELNGCSISIYFNKVYGKPNNKKGAFTPEGKMALSLGHGIHEMIERAIERSDIGPQFKAEVPLEDPIHRIKGTTDGLVYLSDLYVLEFKSCKSEMFQKYRFFPDKNHVQQVHCYMHKSGARVAYIIYYNKNDNKMAQHRIEFKNSIMQPILDRIDSIRTSIIQRTVPTDKAYISCDVLNNPRKTCPNYMRCLTYHKKDEIPQEAEDCLVE